MALPISDKDLTMEIFSKYLHLGPTKLSLTPSFINVSKIRSIILKCTTGEGKTMYIIPPDFKKTKRQFFSGQ